MHRTAPSTFAIHGAWRCAARSLTGGRACRALASSAALLLASVGAAQASPDDIARAAFPSTVSVITVDADGQQTGLASGFAVAPERIVTAAHVLRGASAAFVRPHGRLERLPVTAVEQIDADRGLALLHVVGLTIPVLPLDDQWTPHVGDPVQAAGDPTGRHGAVTRGVISGFHDAGDRELIEITAPISPGSSGGPVLDAAGRVVGVAVGGFAQGRNRSMVVPAIAVRELLERPAEPRPVGAVGGGLRASPWAAMSTDVATAVEAGGLRFDHRGGYSVTVRNLLERPVRSVEVRVVLYDERGRYVGSDWVVTRTALGPGEAVEVWGHVEETVRQVVTGTTYGGTILTPTAVRVISFVLSD